MRIIHNEALAFDRIEEAYSNPNNYFSSLPLEQSLNLALSCKWLVIKNGNLQLGAYGNKIITALNSNNGEINGGRTQLMYYIMMEKPEWAMSLKNGRRESMRFLPDNIVDIFKQLELYDPNNNLEDNNIIIWWDRIAQSAYDKRNKKLSNIGRIGEKLTYEYEFERIGEFPKWIALESDKAGFDFISKKSSNDDGVLCIEVKTTTSRQNQFILTKNEWSVSETKGKDEYLIYFWNISQSNKIKLTIYDAKSLTDHVPVEQGVGEWINSRYDMDEFPSDSIKEIHEFEGFPEEVIEFMEMINI